MLAGGHSRSGTTALCRCFLPRLLLKHRKMNSEASVRISPPTESPMSSSVFKLLPPELPAGGPSGGAVAAEPGGPVHMPEGVPEPGMITVRAIGGGSIFVAEEGVPWDGRGWASVSGGVAGVGGASCQCVLMAGSSVWWQEINQVAVS